MRAALRAALIGFLLCFCSSAMAGSFEDGLAAYELQDYATALQHWRLAAEQGNAKAQHSLGFMYELGHGIPLDYAEAVKWYRLAAAQNDSNGQVNLGAMYGRGLGVPQDFGEALTWFRLAAAQDNVAAQANLGRLYRNGQGVPRDYVQAYMWFDVAAARGHKDAIRSRDELARGMKAEHVASAQQLAREWKPGRP